MKMAAMKIVAGLALCAVVLATPALADPPPQRDPVSPLCQTSGLCRAAGKIRLNGRDGSPMTIVLADPTPYLENDIITIMPNETIVVRFSHSDGGAKAELVSAGPADLAQTDDLIRKHFEVTDNAKPNPQNLYRAPGSGEGYRPPDPKTVRFTMRQAAGRGDTVLIVEDGYEGALRYRAVMVVDERGERPTDVCDVQGGRMMVENWPHPIFELRLSSVRLIPPQLDENGQPVTHCE